LPKKALLSCKVPAHPPLSFPRLNHFFPFRPLCKALLPLLDMFCRPALVSGRCDWCKRMPADPIPIETNSWLPFLGFPPPCHPHFCFELHFRCKEVLSGRCPRSATPVSLFIFALYNQNSPTFAGILALWSNSPRTDSPTPIPHLPPLRATSTVIHFLISPLFRVSAPFSGMKVAHHLHTVQSHHHSFS